MKRVVGEISRCLELDGQACSIINPKNKQCRSPYNKQCRSPPASLEHVSHMADEPQQIMRGLGSTRRPSACDADVIVVGAQVLICGPVQARPGHSPGQSKPGQARAGQASSGQARPGQARAGQARPDQTLEDCTH